MALLKMDPVCDCYPTTVEKKGTDIACKDALREAKLNYSQELMRFFL